MPAYFPELLLAQVVDGAVQAGTQGQPGVLARVEISAAVMTVKSARVGGRALD